MSNVDGSNSAGGGSRTRGSMVASKLGEAIRMGEILPGTKLAEEALAEKYGVSRGPVREALALLARDGLVEMRPHVGAFVPKLTLKEVLDLYEVRNAMFATAVRGFTRRFREGELNHGERNAIFGAFDDLLAASSASADSFSRLSLAVSTVIFENCGNKLLLQYATQINRQSFRFYALASKLNREKRPGFLRVIGMLRQAIEMGDEDLAFSVALRAGRENRSAVLEHYQGIDADTEIEVDPEIRTDR